LNRGILIYKKVWQRNAAIKQNSFFYVKPKLKRKNVPNSLISNKYIRSFSMILTKINKYKNFDDLIKLELTILHDQELTQDKWNWWTHTPNGWMYSPFLNSSKQIQRITLFCVHKDGK